MSCKIPPAPQGVVTQGTLGHAPMTLPKDCSSEPHSCSADEHNLHLNMAL